MTKILFFGTPNIAVPSLQAIAALDDYEIVGVGVFPDRPVGRKQVLTPCPVKTAALERGLPVHEISNKDELVAVFQQVEHDLSIVIAFGMIFPAEVLNQTPLGVVNVHFSLLPEYRGASPVQQAILDGQSVSGITFQRMVEQLDAGDILHQWAWPLDQKTTQEAWFDLAQITADDLPNFLDHYTQGKIKAVPQDETKATFCGKFTKADGQLDPNTHTATQIYNTWRAFQPWPGVSIPTSAGALKLHQVSLEPNQNSVPLTAAGRSQLWITQAQLPGKTRQPIADILRGHPDLLKPSPS